MNVKRAAIPAQNNFIFGFCNLLEKVILCGKAKALAQTAGSMYVFIFGFLVYVSLPGMVFKRRNA